MRTNYITLLKELTKANPRLRFVWLGSVAFTVLASVSIPFSKGNSFMAIGAVLIFCSVMFYVIRSSSQAEDKTLSLPGYMLIGGASLFLWASSLATFVNSSLGSTPNTPETVFAITGLPSVRKVEKMPSNPSFNPQDTLEKVQDKQERISSYFSNLKNNPEFSKNRVDEVLMKTLVREHEAYIEQLDGELKAGLASEKLEESYSSIKNAEDSLFVEAENIYRRYLDRN